MIKTKSELTVCDKCEILHYDNCPDCFGFGVFGANKVPLAAAEAHDGKQSEPCPFCDSTNKGIPNTGA